MDVFSRTFLPAAAETGVATPTATRHLPILRSCVASGDATVLVARCSRPAQPAYGEYLLLLTYRRLVVTQQSRLLHRLRLHLNTELRHLNNVIWNSDPRTSMVELAATAVDGVRERFLIRAGRPTQLWQLDALLSYVFPPRMMAQTIRPATVVVPAGAASTVARRAGTVGGTTSPAAAPGPNRPSRFSPAIAV